uniref:Uncharacterized protein n=1 Tax=Timema poppense TaxID=170557 RepID=A0A7R9D8M6_TIMPO|nr:unnamed protein product [Timema poppensis]
MDMMKTLKLIISPSGLEVESRCATEFIAEAMTSSVLVTVGINGTVCWKSTENNTENAAFVVPWIIGFITFMALEAVAMVYSNVLRDHVNKQFDALCKAEMAFFISRAFLNIISLYGVTQFYNMLRMGISWKGPEAIELKVGITVLVTLQYRKNAVIVPLYKGKGGKSESKVSSQPDKHEVVNSFIVR